MNYRFWHLIDTYLVFERPTAAKALRVTVARFREACTSYLVVGKLQFCRETEKHEKKIPCRKLHLTMCAVPLVLMAPHLYDILVLCRRIQRDKCHQVRTIVKFTHGLSRRRDPFEEYRTAVKNGYVRQV